MTEEIDMSDDLIKRLAEVTARAEAAEVMLPRAYLMGVETCDRIAEAALKKYAKEVYSDATVKVFTGNGDTTAQSAAKTYCAGRILEAIRDIPIPTAPELMAQLMELDDCAYKTKDTTDELRTLRKQYNRVVGDKINLRGEVDILKAHAEAAEKALAEVTAEREAQKRDAMKWFSRALENKHRAEAAEARIATIERETIWKTIRVVESFEDADGMLDLQAGELTDVIRAMIEEKNDG